MFRNIKVHRKEHNQETTFQVTDDEDKNYLYRGTQMIEMLDWESNTKKGMLYIFLMFALISACNIYWSLENTTFMELMKSIIDRTASDALLFSIPLNIGMILIFCIYLPVHLYEVKKINKTIKFIKDESDGMIEKIQAIPIDMTNKTS